MTLTQAVAVFALFIVVPGGIWLILWAVGKMAGLADEEEGRK